MNTVFLTLIFALEQLIDFREWKKLLSTDPFFGQDILENAAAGAQLVAEGFNELWQETLNGSLYGSMCKVGQFFAIATLTLFMVELGKKAKTF